VRLLVAVTFVLLLGAANARAEENLVVNGSFEEVAGGQPANWRVDVGR
jgi:hypothetical protein